MYRWAEPYSVSKSEAVRNMLGVRNRSRRLSIYTLMDLTTRIICIRKPTTDRVRSTTSHPHQSSKYNTLPSDSHSPRNSPFRRLSTIGGLRRNNVTEHPESAEAATPHWNCSSVDHHTSTKSITKKLGYGAFISHPHLFIEYLLRWQWGNYQ